MSVKISGNVPALNGKDWFLFDESGSFTLDNTVMADIWLIGGGFDGGDGRLDGETACGGRGGDGGSVYKFGKVKLLKDTEYRFSVGESGGGVSTFEFGGKTFGSDMRGCVRIKGGRGGIINLNGGVVSPVFGGDGVLTPYGYVGSSGGGGVCYGKNGFSLRSTRLARGGAGSGKSEYRGFGISDAENYGCGGEGDHFFYSSDEVPVKSHGKGGCVIVQYKNIDEENDFENSSDCVVKYWEKSEKTTEELKLEIDVLTEKFEAARVRNEELKKQLSELEAKIAESGENV